MPARGSGLIDAIGELVRERVDEGRAEDVERFARQYYRWAAPEDVGERAPLDLYGAALAHIALARRRQPGTTKVRAYNPDFDQDGWQSTHTAIQVVSDDMPFLVDSISMELSRLGAGLHLLIHPVVRVIRGDASRGMRTRHSVPEEPTCRTPRSRRAVGVLRVPIRTPTVRAGTPKRSVSVVPARV